MKGKNRKGPARLSDLIGPVLEKAGGSRERRPESLAVVAAWPDVVGERLARFSRAVTLEGGRLLVEVSAPAWKQEILLGKNGFIREINTRMGAPLVAEMVIKVRDFIHDEG